LTKATFEKGMLFFLATFRGLETSKETQGAWYGLLQDLTDAQFLQAIKRVCKERSEIFPATNVVAIIRDAVFNSGQRYLVGCHCGEVFNLGGFAKRECPRCGKTYIKGKGAQGYFSPDDKRERILSNQPQQIGATIDEAVVRT